MPSLSLTSVPREEKDRGEIKAGRKMRLRNNGETGLHSDYIDDVGKYYIYIFKIQIQQY